MANQQLGTNTFGVAKWIVSATASDGTHTTIQAAITAASSGDTIFIRPGTYTENLTLKAGVNLVAFTGDGNTPTVTILGTCTFTTAGTVSIGNIQLRTNSAFAIAVTGNAASVLNLYDCYLNCTNTTGISYTSSSGSSLITAYRCIIDCQTTGITPFVATGSGSMTFQYCEFRNTGSTATASSTSVCSISLYYCTLSIPLTTTSTGSFALINCQVNTTSTNTGSLITAGTGTSNAFATAFSGGSASAITIGTGTSVVLDKCTISSSNTNAITGAGSLTSDIITFSGSSITINPSTQVAYTIGPTGTFTPTMVGGSSAGTTTYTIQAGRYYRLGNLVILSATVAGSGATGTGNIIMGGFPFTIKSETNINWQGAISNSSAAGFVFPVGTTMLTMLPLTGTTTSLVFGSGTATGGGAMQMANAAFNFGYTIIYQI